MKKVLDYTHNLRFGYDAKGQVVSDNHDTNNTFDRTYSFDGIGNRTTATEDTTTTTYFADKKNRYISIGSMLRMHDADGNLTNDGTNKYIYDAENRLIEVTDQSDVQIATYEYDYLSRRITKTKASPVRVYRYVYDGWNLLAEYRTDSVNILNKTFTWGQDLSGSMQGAGGVGGLLEVKEGSSRYYPTYDDNGNVSEYLNSSGTVVAHYEYDAFGKTVVATGTKANDFGFKFSTKRINGETGHYYYGYRYYVPETGRWLSRDPIEEDGGLNVYGFVNNQPTKYVDVLGLQKQYIGGSGTYYRPDPFGHGRLPDGTAVDPHVDVIDKNGNKKRMNLDGTIREGGSVPRKDVRAASNALIKVKSKTGRVVSIGGRLLGGVFCIIDFVCNAPSAHAAELPYDPRFPHEPQEPIDYDESELYSQSYTEFTGSTVFEVTGDDGCPMKIKSCQYDLVTDYTEVYIHTRYIKKWSERQSVSAVVEGDKPCPSNPKLLFEN